MINKYEKTKLNDFATDIRIETIRAMGHVGGGHIGGSMSIIDFLAVLYQDFLKINPRNPEWDERDRFILSKGHCGPALYATLALVGYFDVKELDTINKNGTNLPSHCDRTKTKGIDMTTGSLGQGISIAAGMAHALKLKKSKSKVYVVIGDGEMQEGQVWEALQYIASQNLTNIIVVIDNNKKQLDGFVADICKQFNVVDKLKSFGFNAIKCDGHNVLSIHECLTQINNNSMVNALVLETEKGYGCSFAPLESSNHHIGFGKEQADEAIKVLVDERNKRNV